MSGYPGVLDRDWLESIRAASVDELAPRFASVISAHVEGGARYPYADPAFFLPSTVLTPGYRDILKRIKEMLENRTCGSFLLNFDMGTGKTHLLTLILHLYGVCARDPDAYGAYLGGFMAERLYDPMLAAKTVVLAIDMRAPGEVFSKQLRFFAKQLEQVGALRAARIVEEAARGDRAPDSMTLAREIPRDVHVIVLVDELHHALIHASGQEQERVARVVDFLTWFLNYRREASDHRFSALVLILASAKRDLEEWERVKRFEEYRALSAKVDSLVEQLQRIRVLSHTEWLNVDEAKKIIAARLRLGASFDSVFYGFEGFLRRVLREDTDIPQAHHLRSLIKAMAVYAINSLDAGDSIVTPAHFSEEVAGALFLGSQLEAKYRSLYSEIISEAKGDRDLVYAVNAVFTASVTGDEKKQLEMVRQYISGGKEKRGILDIPVLRERDLQDILLKLGITTDRVKLVLDKLDGLHPRLCSVRTAEGYAYFVAPAVSVSALYKQLIRRLEGGFAQKREYITQQLTEKLQSFIVTEQNVVLELFKGVEELERINFREDQLYLLLYTDAEGALDEKHRGELLRKSEEFLRSKRKYNVVIAVPRFDEQSLRSAARYLAINEATLHLIDGYLRPLYQQAARGGELEKLELELLRIQESDVYDALARYCSEAGGELTSALSRYTLLYYTQQGVVERQDVVLALPSAEFKPLREVARVLQQFNEHIGWCVKNVANELARRAKSAAKFLDNRDKAAAAVLKEVEAMIRGGGQATIYADVRTFDGYYVPRPIVEGVLPLVQQQLRKKYENLEVVEQEKPVPVKIIRVRPPVQPLAQAAAQQITTTPTTTAAPAVQRPVVEGASFDELIETLRQASGSRIVVLELEVPGDKLGLLRNILYNMQAGIKIRWWQVRHVQ